MAQTHYKTLVRKALLGFISESDPVLAMLQWKAQQMMLIGAEARVGAEKGKHAKDSVLLMCSCGLVIRIDLAIKRFSCTRKSE